MDTYTERATEQRCADFLTVREWVFGQLENNLPQFAHDIADVLACPPDCDMDAAAKAAFSHWYDRMSDAIAAQPQTEALADILREDAEEEARDDAAYRRECEQSIPNIPAW